MSTMKKIIKPQVLKFNYDARVNYICYGFDGLNGCMVFYQGIYNTLGVDLNPYGDTFFAKVNDIEINDDHTLQILYQNHQKEESVKIISDKQYITMCYQKVIDIYKNGFKFPSHGSILDTIELIIENGKIQEFMVYKDKNSERIGSFNIFHENDKLYCVCYNPWSRYIIDYITLKNRKITCFGEGHETSFEFNTDTELTQTIFSLLKMVEGICIKS